MLRRDIRKLSERIGKLEKGETGVLSNRNESSSKTFKETNVKLRFCPYCQHEVAEHETKCSFCGQTLKNDDLI